MPDVDQGFSGIYTDRCHWQKVSKGKRIGHRLETSCIEAHHKKRVFLDTFLKDKKRDHGSQVKNLEFYRT